MEQLIIIGMCMILALGIYMYVSTIPKMGKNTSSSVLQCSCEGKRCDEEDGCGKSCNTCKGLCLNGQCSCTPNCEAEQECGDDGCGGQCGSCPTGSRCNNGVCKCSSSCQAEGKTCGMDRCGNLCGNCESGKVCISGQCKCVPNCTNRVCGSDGCSDNGCGTCPSGMLCQNGECVAEPNSCVPNCSSGQVTKCRGDDGCGGVCPDNCSGNTICSINGTCIPYCPPGKCSDDCPPCNNDHKCIDGNCCLPNCTGKNCGSDGCGGTCGNCQSCESCVNGQCKPTISCDDVSCGNDSCGKSCGKSCSADKPQCSKYGKCYYAKCGQFPYNNVQCTVSGYVSDGKWVLTCGTNNKYNYNVVGARPPGTSSADFSDEAVNMIGTPCTAVNMEILASTPNIPSDFFSP